MFNNKLHKVLNDNTSGSTALLHQLINGLSSYFKEKEDVDYDDLVVELKELMFHFSSFAVILHFLTSFINWLEINKKYLKGEKCLESIHMYKYRWQTEESRLQIKALNAIDLKNKKVLLHSNSSTIQQIFRSLARQKIEVEVYQTISSPMNEGILQAKHIHEQGFKVHLIADAAVNLIMPEIDIALLGTDAILKDCFINKIGSYYIADFANKYNKSVYVISDTRKVLDEKLIDKAIIEKMLKETPKSPDELYESNTKDLIPLNYYFEKIPNKLITKFIH